MNYCLRYLAPLLGGIVWLLSPALAIPASVENTPPVKSSTDQRVRLTEREDENRVLQPWTIQFMGHPLTATLQYELAADWIRQLSENDPPHGKTRVLLEQQAEVEVFYTLGTRLSFLAQARVKMEKDLRSDSPRGVSDVFVERGEMWVNSEQVFGLPLSIEIGRLDFEDDRRWWWDEDLDAVRVTLAGQSMELALAVAEELGPTRTDRRFIDPAREDVRRVIAEATWDWDTDHTLQLFALHHTDRSPTPKMGEIIDLQREDETDAKFTWWGVRATGGWEVPSGGILRYWVDTARVRGDERAVNFLPLSKHQSVVNERVQRDVDGWAYDLGVTWTAPFNFDPRFTLGYARGSGDKGENDLRDRAFRQTGLNGNAPGFGGVQSFPGYGMLLDPELSNLAILTVGVGWSLFSSSSLDLVYHVYRQIEPTHSLRHARLETALTGRDRNLGHGFDLVLAVEESDWVELEVTASAFRAGEAFGPQRGKWTFGGFAAIRLAF